MRLIDGDKLLNDLKDDVDNELTNQDVRNLILSGKYDIYDFNQGEAARLREALEKIRQRAIDNGTRDYQWAVADEALSSHTEDKPNPYPSQECPACGSDLSYEKDGIECPNDDCNWTHTEDTEEVDNDEDYDGSDAGVGGGYYSALEPKQTGNTSCIHEPEITGGNIYYRCKLCRANLASLTEDERAEWRRRKRMAKVNGMRSEDTGIQKVREARERVKDFIEKSGYSYEVDDIVKSYVGYYKPGYYVSHTTRDCIENLTQELEIICAGIPGITDGGEANEEHQ